MTFMNLKSLPFLLCICLSWTNLIGQDIHFTRFYDAPITLNPAKAGDYLGTFRAGGIIRDQNYNLSQEGY